MKKNRTNLIVFFSIFLFFKTPFTFAQHQPKMFEKYHLNSTFKRYEDTVVFAFKYQNNTADTIVLMSVKPTCGCIMPEKRRMKIAPGESGNYPILFLPKKGQAFNSGQVNLEFDFGMQVLSFSAVLKVD